MISAGERLTFGHAFTVLVLLIGSVIMRSAGCVINDYFDREFDAKVARTANRPIASGVISPHAALVFFVLLCLFGAATLLLLPKISILVGFVCVGLIAFYPLAKRFTDYPQAVLGAVFNAGAPIAYVSAAGVIDALAVAIFLGGAFFTFGYDTIYACQDKKDDVAAGVKSSALALGSKVRFALAFSYAASWFCYAYALTSFSKPGAFSYLLMLTVAVIKFQTLTRFNPEDPVVCASLFKRSVMIASAYAVIFLVPLLTI